MSNQQGIIKLKMVKGQIYPCTIGNSLYMPFLYTFRSNIPIPLYFGPNIPLILTEGHLSTQESNNSPPVLNTKFPLETHPLNLFPTPFHSHLLHLKFSLKSKPLITTETSRTECGGSFFHQKYFWQNLLPLKLFHLLKY